MNERLPALRAREVVRALELAGLRSPEHPAATAGSSIKPILARKPILAGKLPFLFTAKPT
jgi:hypothetical protein